MCDIHVGMPIARSERRCSLKTHTQFGLKRSDQTIEIDVEHVEISSLGF
jgi:hypothetical protein